MKAKQHKSVISNSVHTTNICSFIVQVLQAYLGIEPAETLHIGDQFLNTGNDFAARAVSPCIWIINPQETTYILKSILRLAGVRVILPETKECDHGDDDSVNESVSGQRPALTSTPSGGSIIDFKEIERRRETIKKTASTMDPYTGEMSNPAPSPST